MDDSAVIGIAGETGSGLHRPECALAHASGLLFVPDWSGAGGVAVIAPGGRVHRLLGAGAPDVPAPLRPDGIALEAGGTFLLAHLGDTAGGIFRLHADGRVAPVVTTVDGAASDGALADPGGDVTTENPDR